MSIDKIAGFFLGNTKSTHYHESDNLEPKLEQIRNNQLIDPNKFREKRNKIAELCTKNDLNPLKAD